MTHVEITSALLTVVLKEQCRHIQTFTILFLSIADRKQSGFYLCSSKQLIKDLSFQKKQPIRAMVLRGTGMSIAKQPRLAASGTTEVSFRRLCFWFSTEHCLSYNYFFICSSFLCLQFFYLYLCSIYFLLYPLANTSFRF